MNDDDDDELNVWGVPRNQDGYRWSWDQQQLWTHIQIAEIRKKDREDNDPSHRE